MTDRQRAMEAAQRIVDQSEQWTKEHSATYPSAIPSIARALLAEHRRAEDLARRVEELDRRIAFEEALDASPERSVNDETLVAAGEKLRGVWNKWSIARVIAVEMRSKEAAERRVAELGKVLRDIELVADRGLNPSAHGMPDIVAIFNTIKQKARAALRPTSPSTTQTDGSEVGHG